MNHEREDRERAWPPRWCARAIGRLSGKLPVRGVVALCLTLLAGSGCGRSARRAAGSPAPGDDASRVAQPAPDLGTRTPYHPLQDPATYEPPPAGFRPIFTALVARHGARGLSGFQDDGALYAMWLAARRAGALTALGAKLGPDLEKVIRAHALLGVGVDGISHPGYGNVSALGRAELQGLAARMYARLPDLFASLPATGRALVVASSGIARAVDSATFFTRSLTGQLPALAPLITQAPALTRYPADAPVTQPAGVNHFTLYFPRLTAAVDRVTDPADRYYRTYQASLAYQASAASPALAAKLASLTASPAIDRTARAALRRLFTQPFLDPLAAGTAAFANTASLTFTSDDGRVTTTVTGDGKTVIASPTAAVARLYAVVSVAAAMRAELGGVDLARYLPDDAAALFGYLEDAQAFYGVGPGLAETAPVNFEMANGLVADLFAELDAIASGDLAHGAVLWFSHGEILIPLANALGLAIGARPIPGAATFTYDTSPWRGARVAPFAANVQWDVFRDTRGALLVRMLHNEAEIDFPPACDGARHASASHYYRYDLLIACYHHTPSR